jgi:hypothetical protein
MEHAQTPVSDAFVIFSSRPSFIPKIIILCTFKNREEVHLER